MMKLLRQFWHLDECPTIEYHHALHTYVMCLLGIVVAGAGLMSMTGCTTVSTGTPVPTTATAVHAVETPEQTYARTATEAIYLIDQVTRTAEVLVRANKLKGQDATNVLTAITNARDALRVANLIAATDIAGGTSKVSAALAAVNGLSTYLTTVGAKPS